MEQLSSKLSNYFWSLKKGGSHIKCVVIPTAFTRFGCKYSQIKAESLHLKHIMIVLFQLHCGGVQNQKAEKCISVQVVMDLTVSTWRRRYSKGSYCPVSCSYNLVCVHERERKRETQGRVCVFVFRTQKCWCLSFGPCQAHLASVFTMQNGRKSL